MDDWTGRYLVAGEAVYRIDRDDGETLHATILAGSALVDGRRVGIPRASAVASVALGHERLTDTPPAIRAAGGAKTKGPRLWTS